MAHSYRRHSAVVFVVMEILLFAGAALSTYFSSTINWPWFWAIAAISLVLFAIVRILDAIPQIKDLLAFEDISARIASSAMRYGIRDFYNMQIHKDQEARNSDTVDEIDKADAMWLCANSGASYLDPSIYRHWPAVERRIKDGVPFKIVLLDPFSKAKRLRDKLNIGEESIDSKINIPNLIKLYNKFPSLDIRFVEEGMHVTVFSTSNCLFFDPYHLGVVGQRIENRSFCLKIMRSKIHEKPGYYELFRLHFDSLWRENKGLESWIDSNYNLIYQELPDVNRRHN